MLSVGDSQSVHSVQRHSVDGSGPSTSGVSEPFVDWQQSSDQRKTAVGNCSMQGQMPFAGPQGVEHSQTCVQPVQRTASADYFRQAPVQQLGQPQNPPSLLAAALSTPVSTPGSSAHFAQVSRTSASQGAGQFEHVTVMTQLQHVPGSDVRCQPVVRPTLGPSSVSAPFANASVGVGRLQVQASAAMTQQVQLSVPTASAGSFPNAQSSRANVHRAQPYRNNNARLQKMSISAAMLPIMGRGSAKQLASMAVIGDDGPTVRQHLQQQQQKARLQQQLAMQAKQKEGENATQQENVHKQDGSEASTSGCGPSPLDGAASTSEKSKPVIRTAHVQRPYVPRLSTVQRQRAAAEAVRQLQLQGTATAGPGHISLPPISLMPSRAAKMRKSSLTGGAEQQLLSVAPQALQQPSTSSQAMRPAQYRPPIPISQVQRSHSQPAVTVVAQPTYPVQAAVTRLQVPPSAVQSQIFPTQQRPLDSSLSCTTDVKNGVMLPVKKTPTRKRPQRPPAAQVRVTPLESPAPADVKPVVLSDGNGTFCSQTSIKSEKEDCVEQERKVNPEASLSNPFRMPAKQVSSNSAASTPLVPERHGTAVVQQQKTVLPVRPQFMHPHAVHPGAAQVGAAPARQRITRLPPHVLRQKQEDQMYQRKMYFLKRTIKALVFKNGALCDEVARLNQRIQTVTDERRMLAKRLQHFERNRIRRIQTKMKKEAALAAKINAFQTVPLTVKVEPEREEVSQDATENDDADNESTKTASSSCTPSSLTSAGASRVASPEPTQQLDASSAASDAVARAVKKSKSKLLRSRRAERAPTRTSIGRRAKKNALT